jgi:hypothetical protein
MMSETAQLNFIRLILFAAESYNRIPKDFNALKLAFKTNQEISTIKESIEEIKKSFPKFKENCDHYYFEEFDSKTNYVKEGTPKELPRNSKGNDKESTDIDKEEDKEKKKNNAFLFEEVWNVYPKRIGRSQAERHFRSSVKTDKDFIDIKTALSNYMQSKRVFNGFIMNGSTWFNNWRDWIVQQDAICHKCKGKGRYLSSTGYEVECKCATKQ